MIQEIIKLYKKKNVVESIHSYTQNLKLWLMSNNIIYNKKMYNMYEILQQNSRRYTVIMRIP